MFSLSQAGATPGVGLQLRGACCGPAGSGRQHINLTVGFLFMRFFRIAGFRAQAALRLRGVGAKPKEESILTVGLKKYFFRCLTLYSKYVQRLLTRECAIFRSDDSRERGIAFPASFCLLFGSLKKGDAPPA